MKMNELYIIPEFDRIEESMRLSQLFDARFEYNDFFLPALLDDGNWVRERIEFYKNLNRDRTRDILHGAFLDIVVHSEDKTIRDASVFRIRQSMDIAKELGIRGVVFHTNLIPNFKTSGYTQHWVESNRDFWKSLLEEYAGLEILLENMFDDDPELLHRLAKEMSGEERFGICFDYAHASVFGQCMDNWVDKLLPFAKHIHINDNDLRVDLHLSVGTGAIDWKQFDKYMKENGTDSSVLIEVNGAKKQSESLRYMQAAGIYPFTREESQEVTYGREK